MAAGPNWFLSASLGGRLASAQKKKKKKLAFATNCLSILRHQRTRARCIGTIFYRAFFNSELCSFVALSVLWRVSLFSFSFLYPPPPPHLSNSSSSSSYYYYSILLTASSLFPFFFALPPPPPNTFTRRRRRRNVIVNRNGSWFFFSRELFVPNIWVHFYLVLLDFLQRKWQVCQIFEARIDATLTHCIAGSFHLTAACMPPPIYYMACWGIRVSSRHLTGTY